MTLPLRFPLSAFALPALASAAVAIAVASAVPDSAGAQGCTGAPGASAIQQYCEAVPNADGGSDRPGGTGSSSGGSGSGDPGSGVSQSTADSLDKAGADGYVVKRLAGGTSTTAKKSTPKPKADSATEAAGTDDGAVLAERVEGPADPDGSPLKAATNAVANGPTAGAPLAWGIAGLSIVGVGAAVFFRRRGDSLVIPDDER